ncbi:uncharacterized protein LOC130731525 [Lotus japonicus]|uniref:Uncharacterized protein n=1 Tax=Lotus japonicus TaxID=34305 RepID=I3T6K5_LOTJA|nr:uncharacterized protein LOC130731525 [Lotus japonicus]AFK48147.1 unknown [Lotus japonicus]
MGNCLRHNHQYSTVGGDDSPTAAAEGGCFIAGSSYGEKTNTSYQEVKIKITKKQLEALVGKVEVKGLRVEEMLAHLMEHSGQYDSLHRPWRPALQSIPEV